MQKYARVLLKLSGEFFNDSSGNSASSFSLSHINAFIGELADIKQQGVQIAIVIGGGNLVRGELLAKQGFDAVTGDYMGMLATAINGLMLKQSCQAANLPAKLMSLIAVPNVIDDYDTQQAITALEQGNIVIFAGGTGKPRCTTDSAASHRAVDINAEIILKATKVDGIYTSDPLVDSDADFYPQLSYDDVIAKRLGVMDLSAFTYCRDHRMPIRVFNMYQKNALKKLIAGEDIGTLVN